MDESAPTGEWPAPEWQHQKTPADPDTPVEHRFLLRLRDHPGDLEMRMVFADWLEQSGQSAKAEIIRLLADAPTQEAATRLQALTGTVADEWLAIVTRTAIEKCDARFRFQCPKAWEALTPTDDAAVRHCSTCDQPVYFCTSVVEIRRHARASHCVAFSPKLAPGQGVAEYDSAPTGEFPSVTDEILMGEVAGDAEWLDNIPTEVR